MLRAEVFLDPLAWDWRRVEPSAGVPRASAQLVISLGSTGFGGKFLTGRLGVAVHGGRHAPGSDCWGAVVKVGPSLVAGAEPFEVVEPGEGALDHPPHLPSPEP